MFFRKPKPATAQFVGSSRTTQSCLDALSRLLATTASIRQATLLTADGRHCFYLELDEPEPVFIKGGFTSGYSGEGPAGLAIALHLLSRFEVDVEEVLVSAELLDRVDHSQVTLDDLHSIASAQPVRPTRLWEYREDGLRGRGPVALHLRAQFAPVIPWGLLDERLLDLALVLRKDPDKAVFEAFRRLESLIVSRAGLPLGVVGKEAFRRAFRGGGARLVWPGLPAAEVEGRAQLFEAAFLAYRNPRAHREDEREISQGYREFLLINELFHLEAQAELACSAFSVE